MEITVPKILFLTDMKLTNLISFFMIELRSLMSVLVQGNRLIATKPLSFSSPVLISKLQYNYDHRIVSDRILSSFTIINL